MPTYAAATSPGGGPTGDKNTESLIKRRQRDGTSKATSRQGMHAQQRRKQDDQHWARPKGSSPSHSLEDLQETEISEVCFRLKRPALQSEATCRHEAPYPEPVVVWKGCSRGERERRRRAPHFFFFDLGEKKEFGLSANQPD
jgi:hypothetical protein